MFTNQLISKNIFQIRGVKIGIAETFRALLRFMVYLKKKVTLFKYQSYGHQQKTTHRTAALPCRA